MLPCQHVYCYGCLYQLKRENNYKCPYCQIPIESEFENLPQPRFGLKCESCTFNNFDRPDSPCFGDRAHEFDPLLANFQVWVRPIFGKLIQSSILEFRGMTQVDFWISFPEICLWNAPEFFEYHCSTKCSVLDEFSRNRPVVCIPYAPKF